MQSAEPVQLYSYLDLSAEVAWYTALTSDQVRFDADMAADPYMPVPTRERIHKYIKHTSDSTRISLFSYVLESGGGVRNRALLANADLILDADEGAAGLADFDAATPLSLWLLYRQHPELLPPPALAHLRAGFVEPADRAELLSGTAILTLDPTAQHPTPALKNAAAGADAFEQHTLLGNLTSRRTAALFSAETRAGAVDDFRAALLLAECARSIEGGAASHSPSPACVVAFERMASQLGCVERQQKVNRDTLTVLRGMAAGSKALNPDAATRAVLAAALRIAMLVAFPGDGVAHEFVALCRSEDQALFARRAAPWQPRDTQRWSYLESIGGITAARAEVIVLRFAQAPEYLPTGLTHFQYGQLALCAGEKAEAAVAKSATELQHKCLPVMDYSTGAIDIELVARAGSD